MYTSIRLPAISVTSKHSFSFWSWSKPPQVEFPIVKPAKTSPTFPQDEIPAHIKKPSYAVSGQVDTRLIPTEPIIWSQSDIIKIRESCQLARKVLNEIKDIAAPGVTTEDLDNHARELIFIHGAYPSPLNFHGFPKSISTSVNNVAAHGIPDSRPLQSGDIVNVDVTVFRDGFHGDCSDTLLIGDVDQYGHKLVQVTRECVEAGVSVCGPGKWIRGIGHVIHKHARANDCTTIPLFLGHGIGDFFHGPPDIYHCLNNYPGRMVAGMVFTIEPCVSEGDRRVRVLSDGWTAVTVDNSRTAQTEQTVLITKSGVEILTL